MTPRVAFAIALLGLVLGVALVATSRAARQEASLVFSYDSTDAGPGGVLAFRRWVEALGHKTRSLQGDRFAVPDDVALVLLLGPSEPVRREEAAMLAEWVQRGHTLVVASDRGLFDETLFATFGAKLESRGRGTIEGTLSPAIGRPPLKDLSSGTGRALSLDGPAAVLVGDEQRAIAAVRRLGQGRVILSSAPDLFANVNLPAAQNDRFALNVLAEIPPGSVIAFDEFHHGEHVSPDLTGLLLRTSAGRAVAVAGALTFLYLALRGRRFGRALPIEEQPARSSLDHVRSFAGLLRRSRARDLVAERLARLYRRRLARVAGLRPTSDTAEVVAALGRADPARGARAGAILASLERPLREQDLLASVERAEALVAEVER